MNHTSELRYCGRNFTPQELQSIRRIIAEDPRRTRAHISRLVCKALGWYKPNGGLKDMSCRVALLRMQKDGLLILPPPTHRQEMCRPQIQMSALTNLISIAMIEGHRAMRRRGAQTILPILKKNVAPTSKAGK